MLNKALNITLMCVIFFVLFSKRNRKHVFRVSIEL